MGSHIAIFERGASLREHLPRMERAANVFAEAGEARELSRALLLQSELLCNLGRAEQAAAACERSIAAAISAGDHWHEAISRSFLGYLLTCGPMAVENAIAVCEEHLAMQHWTPPGPIELWVSLGELQAQAGRVDEGKALVHKAQDACRQVGALGTLAFCAQAMARLELNLGGAEAAEVHLRRACEIIDSLGDLRGGIAVAGAELAYAIGTRGPAEAEQLARASRHLAAGDDFYAQVAWRRALGRLKPPEEGRPLLDEAVAICAASDILNLHAATLEDQAGARGAAGDTTGAIAALSDALELYLLKGNSLASARVRQVLQTGA